jgi:hypothetical protein
MDKDVGLKTEYFEGAKNSPDIIRTLSSLGLSLLLQFAFEMTFFDKRVKALSGM